jgi:tetratricopeptide (TPR) repeat protein
VAAVAAAGTWAAGRAARADIIELQDGRKINGSMQRQGDMMVIKGDDGKTTTVPPAAIVKVTLQSNTPPDQLASAEWTRVQAQLNKATTLEAVIDLHKKFLAKYPDQPVSADVKKSLGEYEAMVGKDVVKYRGRWLTKDMIRDQERAWETEAEAATKKYKAGKLAEARQAAVEALAADANNPLNLAIAGLASYRLNELPRAKGYFEKLSAADPGNVLAENNLGVIAFQQKSQPEALVHYTKAIQAKPDNRLVLDNAADAMGAYVGSKEIDAYRNLARQYAQAEAAMETEMAKRGLYRFGSTWIPKDQKEKLGTDRQHILTAMAQLDAKFTQARQSLDLIEQQLRQANADYDNTMTQMASLDLQTTHTRAGYFVTPYQRGILSSQLDALSRRKAELETQRAQATQALQPFFAEATRLKAALAQVPEAAYTGVQRIMEPADVDDPPAPAPLKQPIGDTAATPAPAAATPTPAPTTPVPTNPLPPLPAPYTPTPLIGPGYGSGTGYGGGGGGVPLVPGPAPTPSPTPSPTPTPSPNPSPTPSPDPTPPRYTIPPDRDPPATRPAPPAAERPAPVMRPF